MVQGGVTEMAARPELVALERAVRAIERGAGRAELPPLEPGWPTLGRTEAGRGLLARGAVHEWLGLDDAPGPGRMRGGHAAWTPPLSLLVHLGWAALGCRPGDGGAAAERWVLWIGQRVWPYPQALLRGAGVRERDGGAGELELEDGGGATDRRLLERSLFVDPPDAAGRLWAADAALRCPSVAAVVFDGKGLRMPASRRLQLAAESGAAVGLVARAADEVRELSAATTRWCVRRAPARDAAEFPGDDRPRWLLEGLRCKAGR
jgi:hypothetical protein